MPKLNDQQIKVAKAYQKTGKNIVINARAGSGKTRLILAMDKILPGADYLAFTNQTKDELLNRQPNLSGRVFTTYSVGLKACKALLGEVEVSAYKYDKIYTDLINRDSFKAKLLGNSLKQATYLAKETKNHIWRLPEMII